MFLRTIISGLGIALCLGAAEPTQREVAEWIIRQGGSLTVDGRADPIGRMEDLPAGEPLIRGHAAWALGRLGGPPARQGLTLALRREADPWVRDECGLALEECGPPAVPSAV